MVGNFRSHSETALIAWLASTGVVLRELMQVAMRNPSEALMGFSAVANSIPTFEQLMERPAEAAPPPAGKNLSIDPAVGDADYAEVARRGARMFKEVIRLGPDGKQLRERDQAETEHGEPIGVAEGV